LPHVHSVEGQCPPHAVQDRPDKHTKLYVGCTIMTSTLDIIKTHPLTTTTMVLPHTKLPTTTWVTTAEL